VRPVPKRPQIRFSNFGSKYQVGLLFKNDDRDQFPDDAELSFDRHLIGVYHFPGNCQFMRFIFSDGYPFARFNSKTHDEHFRESIIDPPGAVVKFVKLTYGD